MPLNKKKRRIYSFDVFDTCLTRTCGHPDNVFRLLANHYLSDECLIHSFVKDRKEAERKAMSALNKEVVSIYDIYNFFDLSVYTSTLAEEVLKKEVEIDINSLTPVSNVVDLIEKKRKKGNILFISDMYLPYDVLQKTLKRLGIMKDGDVLYVSCDVGAAKYTGNLFNYVSKQEDATKLLWKHRGDNFKNDFIIPLKNGIRATILKHDYTESEKILIEESYLRNSLYHSLLAGICRSYRLQKNNINNIVIASDIVAPLFISFTLGILQDARIRGIKKLYFMARDSWLFYEIAKVFSEDFKDIELKYLYVSTKVLYPLVLNEVNETEIDELFSLFATFRIRDVLKMLHYNNEEIVSVKKEFDIDKELTVTDNESLNFKKYLLSSSQKDIIIKKCKKIRIQTIAYLSQEGLFENNDFGGIVDIGWRGTSQAIFAKLLGTNVQYYYLGVSKYRHHVGKLGTYKSFIYSEDLYWFSRIQLLIEFYMCRSLDGTTLGYENTDEGIIPVNGNNKITHLERDEVLNVNNTVIDIARVCQRYNFANSDSICLFNTVKKILQNLSLNPCYNLVSMFAKNVAYEHYSEKTKVVQKMYPWTLLIYLLNIYKSIRSKKTPQTKYRAIWLEGSLVYTYRGFGTIINNYINCFKKRHYY